MKTPSFWNNRGIISFLLIPFSWVYALAFNLRQALVKPQRVDVPVICIGGITAGGAGKTPLALHIGEHYKTLGVNAWFLSRGYKGKLKGPIQVKPSAHTSQDVGDEPLLLARVLPTVVAKNRLQGARFAARQGAQIIIMDDGFQNPYIEKTLSLLVMDGGTGVGNGRLIPAGPLREKPAAAFARAQAIVITNPSGNIPPTPHRKLLLKAITTPQESEPGIRGKKVFAFCGLAYPQKFFDTLNALGAHIAGQKIFADHYQYTDADIDALATHARQQDALLVTTSKDEARLSARARSLVTVVHISLVFNEPGRLIEVLGTVKPHVA